VDPEENYMATSGLAYNLGLRGANPERNIRTWPFFYKVLGACVFIILVLGFSVVTVAAESGNKLTGPNGTTVEALNKNQVTLIQLGVFLSVVIILAVGVPWFLTNRRYMKNQNLRIAEQLKTQQELRHEALEKLKNTTELATLMELNQGQIDTYHRIVTEQADKSFKSSRTAMGIGLFLIVCAAIGGAYVPLEQVRWFIGALAAFSTLLSGYLTKTYLVMYRESIGQLNRYFDQPVLNSFYLTAERLTRSLDAEHAADIKQEIIREVLANSSHLANRSATGTPPKASTGGAKLKKRPKKQTGSVNGTSQEQSKADTR
jgi:hypothetical protein